MPDVMGGMMSWMMALMVLIPLLVIVLAAAVIAWAIRSSRGTPHADAPEAPLTILQRRYARGDLGTDEYERMRATLTME